MDYKEKYNEALERAKAAYGTGAYDDATLEFLFPELKVSEDERIIQELKEAFEVYDIESKWNGIPIRSILAWLERQKEQPTNSEIPKELKPEWTEADEKMLSVITYKISQHQGNDERSLFTPDEAEFICEMEDKLKSLRPSWKPSEEQAEQKPVQNPKKGCPTYPLSVVGDLLAEQKPKPEWTEADLEKEIDKVWNNGLSDELAGPHNNFNICANLARHFYKLGKEDKLRNREVWITRAKRELEEEK